MRELGGQLTLVGTSSDQDWIRDGLHHRDDGFYALFCSNKLMATSEQYSLFLQCVNLHNTLLVMQELGGQLALVGTSSDQDWMQDGLHHHGDQFYTLFCSV